MTKERFSWYGWFFCVGIILITLSWDHSMGKSREIISTSLTSWEQAREVNRNTA